MFKLFFLPQRLLYAHKLKLLDWRLQPGSGDGRLQPGRRSLQSG
jgi:hypothetical protein